MTAASAVLPVASALLAAGAGFFGARAALGRREAVRRRAAARRLSAEDGGEDFGGDRFCSQGIAGAVLGYLAGLDRRISHKATVRLSSALPRLPLSGRGDEGALMRQAGLADSVGPETLREGRLRLAAVAAAAGGLVGACLSNELAALFGLAGLAAGLFAPRWAVRQEAAARAEICRREMPEMLEVVVLGLTSGMSFDRSFRLYHTHFDSAFARDCAAAQKKWELGLTSREDSLRALTDMYDSALLRRVVENVARAMRFGTSLTKDLEKAVEDSQAELRASRQEQVAKAPVKMMIPTATLILPAMLLLVLGPVLLELVEGF